MPINKAITLFSNIQKKLLPQAININSSALTDTGLVRNNNEDSYLNLPEYQIWAVLDGMGGHEGGEIASAIAVYHLKKAAVSGQNLTTAIQNAHLAIIQAAIDGLGTKDMGSTIVVLKIQNKQYQISWVGDSRAYLYRSKLDCISKDHSYIQLMLDQGLISDNDIENHPYKHALIQALGGIGTTIKVDTVRGTIQKGDIFLLCSDGLSGEVPDSVIEQTVNNQTICLAEKSKHLVDKALSTGGGDNISLVLIEIA